LIPNEGENVEDFCANKAILEPKINATKLIFFIYLKFDSLLNKMKAAMMRPTKVFWIFLH
jgi:hypothetical protein